MGFSDWLFSNQWYGCLIPLQQAIGCITQFLIQRILGPTLLTAANVLILGITYVFFLFILPAISGDSLIMVNLFGIDFCRNILLVIVLGQFCGSILPLPKYNV